jgi:hypothetical protein
LSFEPDLEQLGCGGSHTAAIPERKSMRYGLGRSDMFLPFMICLPNSACATEGPTREVYFGDPLDCQDRLSGGGRISIRGRMVDYSDRTCLEVFGNLPNERISPSARQARRSRSDYWPNRDARIHSLFERRRKPRLRWCWLGCSFDFFYRGNIKDQVLTRLHPVSTGDLPRDPHTCVFQFFQFSGVAITNLNRIHLLAVNSVCGFEFKNPTCRFSSDSHCSDELTGYGYFLYGNRLRWCWLGCSFGFFYRGNF